MVYERTRCHRIEKQSLQESRDLQAYCGAYINSTHSIISVKPSKKKFNMVLVMANGHVEAKYGLIGLKGLKPAIQYVG